MKERTWAHVGLFTVNFIYGVNYVVAKGLMPDVIGPSGFIVLRVIGAGTLFWLLRVASGAYRAYRPGTPGCLCVLRRGTQPAHVLPRPHAHHAASMPASSWWPHRSWYLSWPLCCLKERITWRKADRCTTWSGGCAWCSSSSNPRDRQLRCDRLGDLFILINATSYGTLPRDRETAHAEVQRDHRHGLVLPLRCGHGPAFRLVVNSLLWMVAH
jgi:hypothetical protein